MFMCHMASTSGDQSMLFWGENKISFEVLHKYISLESATAHGYKYLDPKLNA